MPRKRKSYQSKKKSSKTSYVNFYDKLIKSGKSLDVINRIPNTKLGVKSFNRQFGTHLKTIASLKGKKRLINQIKNDTNSITSQYIEKQNITNKRYKLFLYNEANRLLKNKVEELKDINKVEHKKIKKKGQYGVIKLIDLKDNHEYFMKYHDEESFKKRLDQLLQDYKIQNYHTIFLGLYMYKTHITEEFRKQVKSKGIS